MEGILKEVIIKEVSESASPDKVFIVENLPKKFLLQEVAEMKNVRLGKGDYDEVPTGKLIEVPLSGIERGRKDGSFVFFTGHNEAKDRLADIDRYIEATFPKDQRVPKRVYNSSDLSSTRAYPLQKEDMPRVVLPVIVTSTVASPRADVESVAPQQVTQIDVEAIKAQAIAEYEAKKKEEAKERMAAARAAKK